MSRTAGAPELAPRGGVPRPLRPDRGLLGWGEIMPGAPQPATLARPADGYLITQVVYVAAKLNIADVLARGPLNADALADAVGARPGPFRRILRLLAAEGVLNEGANGAARRHRCARRADRGTGTKPGVPETGLGRPSDAAHLGGGRRTVDRPGVDPRPRVGPAVARPTRALRRRHAGNPAGLGQVLNMVMVAWSLAVVSTAGVCVSAAMAFASQFTHLSEGTARVQNLATSICAVLLAEACNIGLEPLVRQDVPWLTRGRLSWVHQNYLRADTLTQANARLVDYQATLQLAQQWGGGEVASADGLRFVVPVRTLNAGHNPKYFGVGRGVTYYNFSSDQFTSFHAIVIPGTLRDSLFILDGLLEQQTSLRPVELMADTAGSSDVVFGLFWLLGYQFSPRLADIGEATFWRIDRTANYGLLNNLARHRLNTDLIADNWDDLLRVAGSLKLGALSASEFMRTIQSGSRTSTLVRAIAELGRIAKTLFLLAYVDDGAYRRRILVQLNRGEARHRLARAVFHGQRGELRQRYREGQEDQLGALGLVVNAIILWNTRYIERALAQIEQMGVEIRPEDVERVWPLGFQHINMLGRYSFELAEPLIRGELRSLRDPSEPAEEDILVA
jgi:TnpA family transposase